MQIFFDMGASNGYLSGSQIARVLTENWVKSNCYCPSCGNEQLNAFKNNSPVADFYCVNCSSEYELKSKKDGFTSKIVDGAYRTMIERITSDNNPNFFFLNYSLRNLEVRNLLVIPKHFFVEDIIEKRKALGPNARRAGWTGCNILLNSIPTKGKIFLIEDGEIKSKKEVLTTWAKTSFLGDQKLESRGWTIELMKVLDKIKFKDFSLDQVYAFEKHFQGRFPKNNFVKDKIRQQLQVLRDKGLIEFKGRGLYKKL